MPLNQYKKLITTKINTKALEEMKNYNKSKSKTGRHEHSSLWMANYLAANNTIKLNSKKRLIFKIRARNGEAKENQKGSNKNTNCRWKYLQKETQEHVFQCPKSKIKPIPRKQLKQIDELKLLKIRKNMTGISRKYR